MSEDGGFLVPREVAEILTRYANARAIQELGKAIWTMKTRTLVFPLYTPDGLMQGAVTNMQYPEDRV